MKPLTFTLIQSDLHWEDRQANLDMFEQKIDSVKEKMEIVLLPEMFTTGFSMNPAKFAEQMDGPSISWMKRVCASKKIVLSGSLIIEEAGNYHNRLVWMLPNGEYGWYDKRHLFAYAGEDQHYFPGFKRLVASAKSWKINLQVCYDLRFPVWARQSFPLQESEDYTIEYDVLVYVANWPEKRNHAWKTLLQARAIENQCYVIGVNRVGQDGNGHYYSGDSMIVNAMGEALYSKAHEEDVFTYSLDFQSLHEIREKLPFLRDADPFMIGN